MSDEELVRRLREGTFGTDETKTDCVINGYMASAASAIERLTRAEKALCEACEAGLRAVATMEDRAETAERKVEMLREALSILKNSVSRNWGAFERGLREEIGNTNYRCTAEKLDAARAALDETEETNVD